MEDNTVNSVLTTVHYVSNYKNIIKCKQGFCCFNLDPITCVSQ